MTKAEVWQQHIDNWKGSGLSQTVYCKQHKIKQHNMQYWRKRLSTCAEKPRTLIPVTITRSTTVRLMLGSQVSIELPCEKLADVLLALRDRGLLHASP